MRSVRFGVAERRTSASEAQLDPVAAAIRVAAARIGGETARLDAELLIAHAAGLSRDDVLLGRLAAVPDGFATLVGRRAAGEPVGYLTGARDFWDMTLAVSPAVLIPRSDSETLIEAAIDHFAGTGGPAQVLDLGTGSGALLLAALRVWPGARGIGIDRSPAALAVATANAHRLGLAGRAEMRIGDWTGTGARFDLILCNPPYVATSEPLPRDVVDHEPHEALFAGADGLDDYRVLATTIGGQLAAGGIACVEIGAGQADAAGALFAACGLAASVRRDLAGRDRCLVLPR